MVEKYREREREIIRDRKKESETGNKSLIEREQDGKGKNLKGVLS